MDIFGDPIASTPNKEPAGNDNDDDNGGTGVVASKSNKQNTKKPPMAKRSKEAKEAKQTAAKQDSNKKRKKPVDDEDQAKKKAKHTKKAKDLPATKPASAAAKPQKPKPPKPSAATKKNRGEKPAPPKTKKQSGKTTGGEGNTSSGRRKPASVPALVDDIPEDEFIGQFTRAARYVRAILDLVTPEDGGLVDVSEVDNYEAPELSEEESASIVENANAKKIRFSKKSIQSVRWLMKILLSQRCKEFSYMCKIQKKQTLCMDQIIAEKLMTMNANLAATKVVRDNDEPIQEVMLGCFFDANPGKPKLAWKEAQRCAELLEVDVESLATAAANMYNTPGPWDTFLSQKDNPIAAQ